MSEQGKTGGTVRCCMNIFVPIAIIGLAGGLAYYFLADDEKFQEEVNGTLGNLTDKIPDLDLFHKEDPFVDLNGTFAWENDGSGLQLTVVNCLDPQWYEFFDVAVKDWDEGNPDSLTLATEQRDPDFQCEPENGILKVCDGDYGETSWKGINKVLLDDAGIIYASAARMNEYFLPESASTAERQYTMCHEIGHGFGLPHTDENFYNRNQGNCMDYTTRPANNAQPDTRNFKVLAMLYGITGVVPASSGTGTNTETDTSSTSNNSGRNLQHRSIIPKQTAARRKRSTAENRSIPKWILDASDQIDDHFSIQSTSTTRSSSAEIIQHKGWRLLKQNEQHESHEFHIGNGYKIHVHLLLAQPSSN